MLDFVFSLYMEAAGFPKYCGLFNELGVVVFRQFCLPDYCKVLMVSEDEILGGQ